jgi:hypothetical protein
MQRDAAPPRRLLGVTPSRVTFSNTWGTTVFQVLHLVALALCFSMSRGRPFHVFKLHFAVLAKKRPKPFKINGLGALRKPILGHHAGP